MILQEKVNNCTSLTSLSRDVIEKIDQKVIVAIIILLTDK